MSERKAGSAARSRVTRASAAAATATAKPSPTATPKPSPTATPKPSATAKPTAKPTASPAPGPALVGPTWQLTAITEKTPAFQGVVPAADQPKYTVTFDASGSFQATADCNQVAGTYTSTGSGGLKITPGPSTLVMCPEGSLADLYMLGLSNAASYAIATDGTLTITLADGGTLTFKAAT